MAEKTQENQAHPVRAELIPFAGDLLAAIRDGGQGWLGINRTCEALGLNGNAQKQRLERASWAQGRTCMMHVQADGDDRPRPVFCLSVDRVAMWLATIDASRIKDQDIRAKIAKYQNEAADVLDRWVRGSKEPSLVPARPSKVSSLAVMQSMLDALREQEERIDEHDQRFGQVESQQSELAIAQASQAVQVAGLVKNQEAALKEALAAPIPETAPVPEISNRTRAVKLVNQYCVAFGQDQQIAWRMVYGKIKDHYSIDVYARATNRRAKSKMDIIEQDKLWPQLFAVLDQYIQKPLNKLAESGVRRAS